MFAFLFGEYRKEALKNYRARLAAVYLGMAASAGLAACALFVPAYVLVAEKRAATVESANAAAGAYAAESAAIEAEVRILGEKLGYVKSGAEDVAIVSLLEKLSLSREPGISITAISLRRSMEKGAISVSGTASTREALVAFSRNLQGIPSFTSVNLPVSSLAKARDIVFTISIDSRF